MSHECIDWAVTPPRPKTPFITISYGNKKLVTRRGAGSKIHEFKALQDFAHRTFSIQGLDRPPSSLRFRTPCNLGCAPVENGSVFEVGEEAWEEEGLRDLVGCLEVSLCEYGVVVPGLQDELPSRVESAQLSYVDGEPGAETSQPEDAQAHEQEVRVSDDGRKEAGGECGGEMAEEHDTGVVLEDIRARGIVDGVKGKDTLSDMGSEEEGALRTGPSGRGRRVVRSDEEDIQIPNQKPVIDSRRKRNALVVDDPPQPSAPIARNEPMTLHPANLQLTSDAERVVKKEKEGPLAHRSSTAGSFDDDRVFAGASSQSSNKPVKQEPVAVAPRRTMSQPQARRATQEVIAEPAPELKLVISIQHKPSAQHAQFSAKPRTRVGKILAGACKSFRLDVNVAQLYLVVVTQNDKGLKEEDYFLCDREESVINAIAGMDERAEFMIRMPEDPAM